MTIMVVVVKVVVVVVEDARSQVFAEAPGWGAALAQARESLFALVESYEVEAMRPVCPTRARLAVDSLATGTSLWGVWPACLSAESLAV